LFTASCAVAAALSTPLCALRVAVFVFSLMVLPPYIIRSCL
jgi:hypothetical protein